MQGEERKFQEKYGPGWSWMPAWMFGPGPNMVGSGIKNYLLKVVFK